MQILYIFRKISFEVPTQSIQQRKNELCIACFDENAPKTLQNASKGNENFQHLRFCATCVLLDRFGVRILANVQQRRNS